VGGGGGNGLDGLGISNINVDLGTGNINSIAPGTSITTSNLGTGSISVGIDTGSIGSIGGGLSSSISTEDWLSGWSSSPYFTSTSLGNGFGVLHYILLAVFIYLVIILYYDGDNILNSLRGGSRLTSGKRKIWNKNVRENTALFGSSLWLAAHGNSVDFEKCLDLARFER
jgi:hypothetical protein